MFILINAEQYVATCIYTKKMLSLSTSTLQFMMAKFMRKVWVCMCSIFIVAPSSWPIYNTCWGPTSPRGATTY